MKKLIGIILAVCMLFTVAAAANTITQNGDPALDTTNRTVTVKFTGIPGTEQATLFAYEVTDAMITKATPIPAFVSNEATPIKGIDQATVSTITTTEGETTVSSFTFKVAADYVGKMVVKVGGTDAAPISMLVEFEAAVTPDPDPDPDPDPETTILIVGDVNGDKVVDSVDGSVLLLYSKKFNETQKATVNTNNKSNIGAEYLLSSDSATKFIVGDVNGDKVVDSVDGSVLLLYSKKFNETQKATVNTNNKSNIGVSVEVVAVTTTN